MRVAVITPSKENRTQLLEECRASVRMQTCPAALHAVEIDYEGKGPAYVRNHLVQNLPDEYDWIAFLDDDDIMLPEHLEILMGAASNADVVYSLCQIACNTRPFDHEELKQANYIPVTALVRRSMFSKVGGFSNGLLEDWVLWKKIADAGGRFVYVPRLTWIYRVQSDSRNFT